MKVFLVLFFLVFTGTLIAQTEAEGSVDVLQVRSSGEHGKTMHTIGNGDRVKLKLNTEKKWVKGKVSEIQDSSIVVGEHFVQISKIVQFNSPPDISIIFLGFLLFILAAGLGIFGWLLTRVMLKKQIHSWWEWVLVILGALGVVIFLPLFLVGALLLWLFSSRKYTIGPKYILQVFHKRPPSA